MRSAEIVVPIPAREPVQAKARRYLIEGRVVLEHVSPERIEAPVRGSGAIWRVFWRLGAFGCDCPATGLCAHQVAVKMVTATNR